MKKLYILLAGMFAIGMSQSALAQANRAPFFTQGDTLTITICESATIVILDTILKVVDSDAGQTEIWSAVTLPAHGILAAADTAISTGDTLIPSGLSYIPTAGYTGSDTFAVRVSDSTDADTAFVEVSIISCPGEGVRQISRPTSPVVFPNPSNGDFMLNLPFTSQMAHVTIADVLGKTIEDLDVPVGKPLPLHISGCDGIYFIRASAGNERWNGKVLIQH